MEDKDIPFFDARSFKLLAGGGRDFTLLLVYLIAFDCHVLPFLILRARS